MPNPYAAGGMVTDPKMFFGREDILRMITTRLATKQSTSVVGQRRIGKSSLLQHLAQHVQFPQDDRMALLHVDMLDARCHTAGDFFTSILAALDAQSGYTFKFGPTTTNGAFANAIERLNQAGIRPVLLLDEFEEFAHHPDQFNDEFFEQLRALGQAGKVAFVTTSQRSLEELTHQGNLTSPFYNIFVQADMGLLEPDAARQLICEPMKREGLKPDKATVDLALELAGRHAFYLHMAGALIYDALEQGTLDPDAIRRKFAAQAESHFAGLWKHLNDAEWAALYWVIDGTFSAPPPRLLRTLERKGMIEGADGAWQLFSLAFAHFVRESYLPGASSTGMKDVPKTPPNKLTTLRENLDYCFSEGELRTLCLDLEVDYESLPGQGKADKTRELVSHLERRGRIPELIEYCSEQRPRISW